MDSIIILDAQNREELVIDDLRELMARLAPIAAELDCTRELAGLEDIISRGAGYERQRAMAAAARGDLRQVAKSVVQELSASLDRQ